MQRDVRFRAALIEDYGAGVNGGKIEWTVEGFSMRTIIFVRTSVTYLTRIFGNSKFFWPRSTSICYLSFLQFDMVSVSRSTSNCGSFCITVILWKTRVFKSNAHLICDDMINF